MPKYKVTSRLMHDGALYDVEGNAEGKPHEVELSQDLADRCGAVDPVPLPTPEEAEAAANKGGKKKAETPKADA